MKIDFNRNDLLLILDDVSTVMENFKKLSASNTFYGTALDATNEVKQRKELLGRIWKAVEGGKRDAD